MPRKKQKGPPPRSNRPGGPKSQNQGAQKGNKQSASTTDTKGPQKLQPLQQNQRPIVPFLRGDRILLVGEGELIRIGRIVYPGGYTHQLSLPNSVCPYIIFLDISPI